MAYGLRVRNKRGETTLDSSQRISRFMWNSDQTASSGNATVSQIEGLKTVEFALAINIAQNQCTHSVSRSGTTITWTARSLGGGFISSATCVMFSFAYT